MIVIPFTADDVAATRFVISPLWETVSSRWAVRSPERHALHLPWTKRARLLDRRRDLAPHVRALDAVIRPGAWMPDFISPQPGSPLARIEDELEAVRGTSYGVVRAHLAATTTKLPLTADGQALHDDPATHLPRLVDALACWWREAVAPDWARMQALLEADIGYRARTLADRGPGALFESLHPNLHWREERLEQDYPNDLRLDLGGGGLPLMPSVFLDGPPVTNISAGSPVWMIYSARAVGTLWERPGQREPGSLGRLLGPSRARLLAMLDAPHTTTRLATRSGLTPGGVSSHLAVLVDAGLATRNRQGREVVYLLTDAGRVLLGAAA